MPEIERERGKMDGIREGIFSPSISFTIYSYTFRTYFLGEVILSFPSFAN